MVWGQKKNRAQEDAVMLKLLRDLNDKALFRIPGVVVVSISGGEILNPAPAGKNKKKLDPLSVLSDRDRIHHCNIAPAGIKSDGIHASTNDGFRRGKLVSPLKKSGSPLIVGIRTILMESNIGATDNRELDLSLKSREGHLIQDETSASDKSNVSAPQSCFDSLSVLETADTQVQPHSGDACMILDLSSFLFIFL